MTDGLLHPLALVFEVATDSHKLDWGAEQAIGGVSEVKFLYYSDISYFSSHSRYYEPAEGQSARMNVCRKHILNSLLT